MNKIKPTAGRIISLRIIFDHDMSYNTGRLHHALQRGISRLTIQAGSAMSKQARTETERRVSDW